MSQSGNRQTGNRRASKDTDKALIDRANLWSPKTSTSQPVGKPKWSLSCRDPQTEDNFEEFEATLEDSEVNKSDKITIWMNSWMDEDDHHVDLRLELSKGAKKEKS